MAFVLRIAVVLFGIWVVLRIIGRARNIAAQIRAQNGVKPPRKEGPKVVQFKRAPHVVLGVGEDASQIEIHAAWEELRAKHHPEKAKLMGPEYEALAERRLKEIDEAYQALMDEN